MTPGSRGKCVPTEFCAIPDHGSNSYAGDDPHRNPDRTPSDEGATCTGNCATPGFGAYTHIVKYFSLVAACNGGKEHIVFAITGDDARAGGGVTTRLGAIAGYRVATVVGVAAAKDAFDDVAAGGNFVCTTCTTN